MLGRKRKVQEDPNITVIMFAKSLYEKIGDKRFDQFADLVIAHMTDVEVAELPNVVPKVAPTPEAAMVATREPTNDEWAAARVLVLVGAYAFTRLDDEAAHELMLLAGAFATRFAEYQRAAGR